MDIIWLVLLLAVVKSTESQVARASQGQREIHQVPSLQCQNKVADVYFLLDSSTSIYIEDYERQRQFVREVVNRFDISPQSMRVGALAFSRTYQVAFELNQYSNKRDLVDAINYENIPYLTGVTNTAEAIRYVRTSSDFRRDITKVIVVITDGYSQDPAATAAEAASARRDGFYLYVIGIGQYTDEREWRDIASDPDDRFMFNITDYHGLDRLYNNIPERICQLPPIIINKDTCTARLDADLMFVAGPRGVDNAFSIVQNMVRNINADDRRLNLNLLLGACTAETSSLEDPRDLCTDFGETTFTSPDTYLNLLKDMRAQARDMRSRRPNANQVAVLFLDNDSMTSDRFGILREARDAQFDGINVFVVDLGVAHFMRNVLSRIASSQDRVFNTAHPQGISALEAQLLQSICSDLNGLIDLPTLPPF